MNKKIAFASLVWGVSILLSRVIGLGREAVVGRTLALSAEGDLYQTAFTVPDFLNYLLAGGALTIVFLPIYGAHLARGDRDAANKSFSTIANVLALALCVLTIAAWIAMPALVPLAAPGLDAAARSELVSLSRILLPAQIFHVLGGLLSAVLLAHDKHLLPALAPLVYNAGIIAGGAIGGVAAGADGFAWGVLCGSALGPFALPFFGARRCGLRWSPRIDLRLADLRRYVARSLPIMIGVSIVVADDWFLKARGTELGTGAAAALGYAKTMMKVPVGIFGFAAGMAAFPTLQRMAAEGRFDDLRSLLVRGLRLVIVLALYAQVVASLAGRELVALLYGRARLAEAQVDDVARLLWIVSLGMIAWSAQPLLARGFYALGNTWSPAILGTLAALVFFPVYGWCATTEGTAGLAATSAVAISTYVLVLAFVLARTLARRARSTDVAFVRATDETNATSWITFFARCAVSAASAFGSGFAIANWLPRTPILTIDLARVGVIGGVTALVFVLVARVVQLEEISAVWTAVRARIVARRAPRA